MLNKQEMTKEEFHCLDSGTQTDADVNDKLTELRIICLDNGLDDNVHVKFIHNDEGYKILVSQTYLNTEPDENLDAYDNYEYDPDRQRYYNPDDYGGFPSHW